MFELLCYHRTKHQIEHMGFYTEINLGLNGSADTYFKEEGSVGPIKIYARLDPAEEYIRNVILGAISCMDFLSLN